MRQRLALATGFAVFVSVFSIVSAAPQRTAPPPAQAAAPTFAADVAPILYKHCVECHRPGEIAPMSLLTYDDVRPWAKAIRDEVADGNMPPWHADPAHGKFRNARVLTAADKDTITRWANAGAPRGDAAKTPKPPAHADGWRVGTPDVVLTMPKPYTVKADGMIDYQYFDVPTNFTEDKFVRAVEIRPGNREVVHHALLFTRAPAPPTGTPRRRMFTQPRAQQEGPEPVRLSQENAPTGPTNGLLATFAPGTGPVRLPQGAAIRIPAGSSLVFQMHYTATGTAATDQTTVGMVFADAPPKEQIRATHFMHMGLMIPAGAPEHKVDAEITFAEDVKMWGLVPHTHVRGAKWHYEAV